MVIKKIIISEMGGGGGMKEAQFVIVTFPASSELEFLNSLWGLGTD
jgi:hypothetical protein